MFKFPNNFWEDCQPIFFNFNLWRSWAQFRKYPLITLLLISRPYYLKHTTFANQGRDIEKMWNLYKIELTQKIVNRLIKFLLITTLFMVILPKFASLYYISVSISNKTSTNPLKLSSVRYDFSRWNVAIMTQTFNSQAP